MNAPQSTTPIAPTPPGASAGRSNAAGHGDHEEVIPKDLRKPGTITVLLVVGVFIGLLAGLFILGWYPREKLEEQTEGDSSEIKSLVPIVSITVPKPSVAVKDILLPADVRPNQETAIFPRTNGYLKTLKHDINDRVKKDELLAEIDTPEVDAQLEQAKAALAQAQATVVRAQADLDLAKRTMDRYIDAQKEGSGSVTEQQVDERRSTYDDDVAALALARATVKASEANVQQLAVMQSFEKVTAPFDGIITARTYDVGALLGPNASNVPTQLFRISQTDPLRVFASVPQNYATNIKIGDPAYLSVRNYPGKEFQGIVARTAGQIDTSTRTLLVETHFPNPDGTLYPGMYGTVRLSINDQTPALVIPASALIFNATGLQVGIVQDNKVHLQPIKIGRDLGTELEVTTGLTDSDRVITNPSQRIAEGLEVQTQIPQAKQADAPEKGKTLVKAPTSAKE